MKTNTIITTSVQHPLNEKLSRDYAVDIAVHFAGVEPWIAVAAAKQAFIAAGKFLVQKSLLSAMPKPDGVKQGDWMKELESRNIASMNDFPSIEEVLIEAQSKMEKVLNREEAAVKRDPAIEALAAAKGISYEALMAKFAEMAAAL
jgi:hypothetical protein